MQVLSDALAHPSCPLQLKSLEIQDIGDDVKLSTWKTFLARVLDDSKIPLVTLDLSHNFLSCEHVYELSKSLKGNKTLKSLLLSENFIGDEGAAYLCDALNHNSTLVLLALGVCNISNVGLKILTGCLCHRNRRLERIYLYANPLDHNSPMKTELTYWLELNAHGRRYLQHEHCRPEWMPRIFAKVESSRPDLLYGLLQELPHGWAPSV